jgi:hypothetical protein
MTLHISIESASLKKTIKDGKLGRSSGMQKKITAYNIFGEI